MGFVALKRLRWGEETIMPGETVPEDEEGRSYASLLAHGLIAETADVGSMSDEELAKHANGLQEKLDAANERIGELEGGNGTEPVEVPDEVIPGITPGWPLDAVTGQPLALSDEQRTELTEKEIAPEGTEEEPVLGIVTFQGEFVVVAAPETDGAAPDDAAGDTENPTQVDATDAAVALAEAEEIDLSAVEGTGKGGRVVETDVQAVIAARDAGTK